MSYASCCLLAGLLAVCTIACQRASVAPTPAAQQLIGEWHWVSSQGGFTGKQLYTPASTGTTSTWVFQADGTYQLRTTKVGGAPLMETGTFSLGTVNSIYSGQPAQALILRGDQAQTFVIEELTTRLALADNSPDGFGHTYER